MGTIKRTYKLDEAVLADAVALAEKKRDIRHRNHRKCHPLL